MKKTFITAAFVTALTICNGQVTDSLMGPRVWLRADRSILENNQWTDVSFFKNHATGLSTPGTPSTYSDINFNKALIFDGVDDYLKVPYSLEGLAELTILSVFLCNDTTERGIWGTEESASRNVLLTTRRCLGPDTVDVDYGKNEKLTVLSSVLQNWEKASTSSPGAFMSLGSAGVTKSYHQFRGAFAELIVFNRSLTFLERIQYQTYLAIKYGTGLRGGNFVSSDEEMLWHVERNAAYGRNIAGIGRDDHFQLYQKQSGSAYDTGLLVISAGGLAASNDANATVIADQDFIIWGDNGLPLNARPGDGNSSVLSLLQRKWLITVSGNTASTLPTELYIDEERLPADPLGYWLVIDRSGRGNFSADNLEYITPDRIENGKVIYKDVHWDTDGSGQDNFGFARERKLLAVVRTLADPSCTDREAGRVRVEVISGHPSYHFRLVSDDGTMSREWRQKTSAIEQSVLTQGDYILTVKDDAGETLVRNFSLHMPDGLAIDLGPDQKLSASNPIVLDVTSQVPDTIEVTYRWENSFGFASTDPKITVTENGVYRVFVTKIADGCTFTDDVAITGAQEQRIAVYPTLLRSGEDYNVSVSLPESAPVLVRIFNSHGSLTEIMEATGNAEYQFITTLRDPGLYLVVIQTATGIETHKIVAY